MNAHSSTLFKFLHITKKITFLLWDWFAMERKKKNYFKCTLIYMIIYTYVGKYKLVHRDAQAFKTGYMEKMPTPDTVTSI